MNLLVIQLFCSDFRCILTKQYHKMKFTPNENVLRVALLVFSVCFGVLSISLIALGVVYMNELGWPRRYIGLDFLELPTLVIILGAVSLVLSIGGCVCAKSYNRTVFLLFGVALCVVLCLELTIGIIAFENTGERRGKRTQELLQVHFNSTNAYKYFQLIEEHVSLK